MSTEPSVKPKKKRRRKPTFDAAVARLHRWMVRAGQLATPEQAQVLADLLLDVSLGIRGALTGIDMSGASIVVPNDELRTLLRAIDNYVKVEKKTIGEVVALLLPRLGTSGETKWT